MSYLVLARKYRPQTFDEVIKQDHITRTLTNAISQGRVSHAVLFSGPRGTGKTTVARILAKAMNCKDGPTPTPCNICRSCREITSGSAVDVFEIDGASNNSVDQIRDLRENLKYMPAHSPYKIYIIDEVHMLSIAAFNALLKSLEEPPEHILFIFATTEAHKIPITILSRCQRHEFRRIDIDSIANHLKEICAAEDVDVDQEGLWLMAREADGSMRDALSLLDQVMAGAEKAVSCAQVLDVLGVIDRKTVFDITEGVLRGDVPRMLELLEGVYERGHDIRRFYADLLAHFRNMLVVKMGRRIDKLVDLPGHEIERIQTQVKDVSAAFLKQLFDFFFQEETTVRNASQPKLAVEMAFIKISQIKPALPIDVLVEKLDAIRRQIGKNPPENPGGNPGTGEFGAEEKGGRRAGAAAGIAETSDAFEKTGSEGDEDLTVAWERIREVLSNQSPALATNLTNSTLKRVSDHKLELAVNGNGFNISMIRRKKNMNALKGAVKDFFGERTDIVIHTQMVQNGKNPEQRTRENRLKQEALSHPLVAEAIEIFNGKVVDVKVL